MNKNIGSDYLLVTFDYLKSGKPLKSRVYGLKREP